MKQTIKLVVFDIGGTVVDHGCMAPVVAIVEAMAEEGLAVSHRQAREPMGLHKRDHIRELLRISEVAQQWHQQFKRPWNEDDVQRIYELLVPRQKDVALRHVDLIHGVVPCVASLRERGIAVAGTTGYPRSVAQPILDVVSKAGFCVDSTVCADEVPAGRPSPWMIFRNMERLNIFPPAAVLKVGDTVPDIQAALNAGALAVAITETGSEFGLTPDELASMPQSERDRRHEIAEARFREAGADFVIRSPRELCGVLESI